jgi:hypothetical protein
LSGFFCLKKPEYTTFLHKPKSLEISQSQTYKIVYPN